MNKILSIMLVTLFISVAIPVSALAACHGHGSGAAGLSGKVQNQVKFCTGGGYISANDPTAHCPK